MSDHAPAPPSPLAKDTMRCPCGTVIRGADEDDLVAQANRHLEDRHPDLAGKYSRDDILFLAY